MKKSFSFHLPDRDDPRTLEAIKHEVRKYLKRERRKPVATGADFWDFDCKVGRESADATTVEVKAVTPAIDVLAAAGAPKVYVEILAKPGYRPIAPLATSPAETTDAGSAAPPATPA